MRGISWPTENQLASQEWLCSVELDVITAFFRSCTAHLDIIRVIFIFAKECTIYYIKIKIYIKIYTKIAPTCFSLTNILREHIIDLS